MPYKKLLAMLALCASAAYAGEPRERAPRPWELTLEERLQRRLDPGLRAARIAEESRVAIEQGRRPVGPGIFDVVVGARNPELFLPIELFESLLGDVERVSRGKTCMTTVHVRAAGFDEAAFWQKMSAISASALEARARVNRLSDEYHAMPAEKRPAVLPGFAEATLRQCRTAHAALEAARREFGTIEFDRLLYSITEGMTHSILLSPGEDQPANLLRYAGGCP